METKMKRATYLVCCLAIGSAAMISTLTAKAQATDDDKKFLTEASQGNYDEIQLGKLAEQKATNPDVKAFGQRMVTDHTKLGQKMKPYADEWGIAAPTGLSPDAQKEYDKLSRACPAMTSTRNTSPTWSATTRRISMPLPKR